MFDKRHCFMKAGDLYGYLLEGIPHGFLSMATPKSPNFDEAIVLFSWVGENGEYSVSRSVHLEEFYYVRCTMKEFAEQILKLWADTITELEQRAEKEN